MKPIEHKFVTVSQFIEIVQHYSSEIGWIFRGQDDITWPLRPKAGRPEYYSLANEHWIKKGQVSGDLARFIEWRENAIAVCDSLPKNDFDCLAYAQHYGLATRLLDWSTNPLAALFFAVEKQGETDGAVFCHFAWMSIIRDKLSIYDIPPQVFRLTPSPFDRRIVAQSGVFTYHHNPIVPLEANEITPEAQPLKGQDLVVLRVLAKMKPIIQRQLCEIGITRKTFFPDLEGLSAFVNWEAESIAKREKKANSSLTPNSPDQCPRPA